MRELLEAILEIRAEDVFQPMPEEMKKKADEILAQRRAERLAKIKADVEKGDYEIKYNEDCHCGFDWSINNQGDLVDDVSSDECYEQNVLYVGDEMIAAYVRFDGRNICVDDITKDDIPDEIWDEMDMSDMVNRGETGNSPSHDANRKSSLVEFLMDSGYILEKDEERGFGNEYTMVLREPNKDEKVETAEEEAESWADDFLYAGDAPTEAMVGFRFERAEK